MLLDKILHIEVFQNLSFFVINRFYLKLYTSLGELKKNKKWSIKLQNIPPLQYITYLTHLTSQFRNKLQSAIHTNRFTLSLNLELLFRMPHTCAVENGGLNTSPESSARTPPSHQTRLLRVRSSRSHGSRHRAPLSSLRQPNIPLIALSCVETQSGHRPVFTGGP